MNLINVVLPPSPGALTADKPNVPLGLVTLLGSTTAPAERDTEPGDEMHRDTNTAGTAPAGKPPYFYCIFTSSKWRRETCRGDALPASEGPSELPPPVTPACTVEALQHAPGVPPTPAEASGTENQSRATHPASSSFGRSPVTAPSCAKVEVGKPLFLLPLCASAWLAGQELLGAQENLFNC